jgi:hypothetical protein
MKEYAFDVKLQATLRVKANSEREARSLISPVIECMDLTPCTVDGFNDGHGVKDVELAEATISHVCSICLTEVDGAKLKQAELLALLKVGTIVETVGGSAQGDWDEGDNEDGELVRRDTVPGDRGRITDVYDNYCTVDFGANKPCVNPAIIEFLDTSLYLLYRSNFYGNLF